MFCPNWQSTPFLLDSSHGLVSMKRKAAASACPSRLWRPCPIRSHMARSLSSRHMLSGAEPCFSFWGGRGSDESSRMEGGTYLFQPLLPSQPGRWRRSLPRGWGDGQDGPLPPGAQRGLWGRVPRVGRVVWRERPGGARGGLPTCLGRGCSCPDVLSVM